ncbi:MAG: DUF3098 domain-containing protein [Saprospiraceae bacterium]|nr:DUF3098 domain-containing protein [Saprospiraceae bacterium]
MSQPKKKVVVTTTTQEKQKTNRPTPTASRTRQAANAPKAELLFTRQNYMWMGIGVGLIALGLILMSGGQMPSPDVWEPERIYGFRRTVLAPIVILAGLVVEIYAIFKK